MNPPAGAVLRLGTRRSPLALNQSRGVARAINRQCGRPVELVEITSAGDRTSAPLASLGGTGVFVSTLRSALVRGVIDLAVHSLKDLPTAPADGLTVAAIPARADVRDAVISRDRTPLAGLPAGARVGTGSPRRAAQLLDAFPRLQIVQIRGNVQTRIDTIAAGRVDAVILAAAGLGRLDLLSQATQLLDPSLMVPAPGQAALAVECRSDDEAVVSMLSALEDPDTRAAVTAERALLTALEAGCSAPVGALAERYGADLVLRVAAGGPPVVRHVASGSVAAPADLGRAAADHLLNTSAGLTAREGGPAGTHYASSGVGS